MDSENETRPLLPSFEGESWRSRTRKRCMRIPSEITITGIILGLFLIVVTLLIVLQDMETENKDDISLDQKLLASPFKYNKKVVENSWQDDKAMKLANKERKLDKINKGWKNIPEISDSVFKYNKNINEQSWKAKKEMQMKNKERKLDKINKGWKQIPIISGKIINPISGKSLEEKEDSIKTLGKPEIIDDYGKEVDDSLEYIMEPQMSQSSVMQKFNEDVAEIKRMLHSSDKWKEIDEGWKKLSELGWKDREIRRALAKALAKKRQELMEEEYALRSPISFDEIWDNIIESWKKNVNKGKEDVDNDDIKGIKEENQQISINDNWKNKVNTLQSPKASIKNFVKNDPGWEKLSEQGWKNKDIEEAIIQAWQEKENLQLQQAPMDIQGLFGKATDFFKNLLNKGTNQPKSQLAINDKWANKFNSLQSPMSSSKKSKKDKKNKSKDEWKGKTTDENTNEANPVTHPPISFEIIIELIIANIKDQKIGNEELENQSEENEQWKNETEISYTSMQKDKKWKQIDDHWKHEKNTKFGRKDGDVTLSPKDHENNLQKSMAFDEAKWKKVNNGWKTIMDPGLKDKFLKEAVDKAWIDGNKLLNSAMGSNDMKWKKVNNGWKKVSYNSSVVQTACPFSKFHRQLLLGSTIAAPLINCALITEEVRREFGECIDLSFLPKECKPSWREKCFSSYKYRKLDGTCNNQIHPTWGKSGTPFVRMIAPEYADGVSSLRVATDGEPLPNPRFLSRMLYSKKKKPDSDTSVLFMYFGLLVDHDMVETATNSESIPCCREDFQLNPKSRPKECLQIDIPRDDPFYAPKGVTCLNLVRSVPVNGECAGRREQLNKATSFLDGSVVYGSSTDQMKELRSFSRGQLKSEFINNTPFMTYAEGDGYICGTPKEPLKCFKAGDSRVNMMVELTAMHTLWYREHNRIATELHKLNPHWRDEIVFQEARRILVGELQQITYNEFLPVLLGEKAMEDYELKIDEGETYKEYDETVDPSVFNEFAAAAFRFGHSLVPILILESYSGTLKIHLDSPSDDGLEKDTQYLFGANDSTPGKVLLHETFFNGHFLHHNGLDLLLRGAVKQRSQSVDSYITPEVRDHLFQPSNLDYGYDLAAVGIQRGRDHGLPSYIRWRSVCGLSKIRNFDDLRNVMDADRADMFRSVYKSVEDIDLVPAALAEYHVEGSLVGPTYTCLIGRQFKKTRKADRFWFEIQKEIGSFTRSQLDQIYKSNMARIICDNSDRIKEIQRYPFKVPSNHNVVLDCEGIPKVDLSKWSSNL